MRDNSSQKIPETASVSRRRFLAGAVAVPAVVVAPAAIEAMEIDDNYDELVILLDQHAELKAEHIDAIRIFDAIDRRNDKPQSRPGVGLLEFFGQEHTDLYYRGHALKYLTIDPQRVSFHEFFEEQIQLAVNRAKLKPEWADWPVIKTRDYAKVAAEIHQQIQRREQWEQDHGYQAAEADVDRLLMAVCEIETKICSLPVRSLRDLQFKLQLVARERWALDEDDLRLILASVADFATSKGGAPRQERGAV